MIAYADKVEAGMEADLDVLGLHTTAAIKRYFGISHTEASAVYRRAMLEVPLELLRSIYDEANEVQEFDPEDEWEWG